MKTKSVNCLGIIVVDALSGPFDHYPRWGREAQVVSPKVEFKVGGGAANSAAALARLRVPTGIFAKLGQDSNGAFALGSLKHAGVRTNGVRLSLKESTPFTFVGIRLDGDRTFVHTPGANLSFGINDLDMARLLKADFLFYQDYWILPRLDGTPAARLLKRARKAGVTTFLDECWGLGPHRASLEKALPFADYFLPSYDDLTAAYGRYEPETLARLLQKCGARKIVLKLGKRGCLLWDGATARRIPACARKVVDTTGAGDCFDAGFIAAVARDYTDEEACEIGQRAAAACVGQYGGTIGKVTFEKLVS